MLEKETSISPPHPECDDVPLINAKLQNVRVALDDHQLPFAAGFQVLLGVHRHLLEGQGRTDSDIPDCEVGEKKGHSCPWMVGGPVEKEQLGLKSLTGVHVGAKGQ